ncbi:type II secretion system minor pseudopilin GspJ [Escherichia coli]|nr:type II secretion system minor pseudopilin GspJ [Escherichia coli]OAC10641.1 type II secretion system protein J [Escherichia coli]OAC42932.1 type II secretion system protein J [Escherichia coli]SQM27440.1 type II secretion protein GspJ [Escherichia coli]SQM69714.1 type II secretion protein GspJ [Escherichia coli]
MVPVAQETTVNTVRLPYSFSRRFSLVAWCEASLEILHVHPLSLSVLQELQRGLNSAVADHDQKLNLMQQTMSFLTHDLTQMMPRPVRGDQGQREPALLAGAGVLASESEGMRFVRGGVVNPLMRLPRSNLLTVGYRIHDGYLERLAWPLTDAAGSVKPTMQKLIPADSLRLQFYDGTRWQESWSSVQAIPVAVRMTLHSPQWGEIERIWLLRGPQ